MEINNFSYFNSDNKCYKGISDNLDLKEDFYIYIDDIEDDIENPNLIDKCKSRAIESNKDFFLLTDLSLSSGSSKSKYKCLIPKANKICDFSNLENLIQPFNSVLNRVFGSNDNRTIKTITSRLDLANIQNNLNDVSDCVYINSNSGKKIYFAKNNNFILYKTHYIDDNDVVSSLQNVKSYSYYKKNLNLDDISYNFYGLLDINNNTSIYSYFKRYICNPNSDNKDLFENSLKNLSNKYAKAFNYLDELVNDISTITILTEHDTLYLQKIQEKINNEKKQLKSILGFDGANNGKLHDTKYLKNIKLSEIIILSIIMALCVFIYSRKK